MLDFSQRLRGLVSNLHVPVRLGHCPVATNGQIVAFLAFSVLIAELGNDPSSESEALRLSP